jgi:hypothetical protein
MTEYLLANASGMTTVVYSEGDKNDYLRKGYHFVSNESKPVVIPSTSLAIAVNSLSVKDWLESFKVTRTIAKVLNDNKPYKSVDELIAIAPDINWTSYQLSFD